jgi:serine/threonine protein phosphatase PrpC
LVCLHHVHPKREKQMDVIARLKSAGLSDPGRKRDNNEDRFHCDPDRGIFFVVDGVGGHNAGEKAAETAYNLLRARLERPTGTTEERIREAITVANNEIHALGRSNPQWGGMACVLTVAVIEDGQVVTGHVGDSRLYMIQSGDIRKLTHDHSPVGEREDRGEIDEITAMRHPRRNEVFRDVGSDAHSPDDADFIDIIAAPFASNAALLLCSDGLSDMVPSAQILAIVEAHAHDPQWTARALIDAANEAGGKDNVTVVVVHGRDFSSAASMSGARRPVAAPPPSVVPRPRKIYAMPILSIGVGLLIATLLVAVTKPHWRDTGAGTVFGLGVVPEPRTLRVQADIGDALAQARRGDTILVAPGTYPEQLQLRDGIALVSERPREAVLQTSGVAITADAVRGARIEGFRIISDEGQPLTIGVKVNDADVTVVDMEISNAQTAGVEVLGNSSGTFRANQIADNPGTGVIIRDTAKPRFVHNSITGNGRGSGTPRPGIEVAGSAQPILSGNVIARNAAEPIWAPQLNLESLTRQNFVMPAAPSRRQPRARPSK